MKLILPMVLCVLSNMCLLAQQAGDLIITEIMLNPDAVSDGAGEWFEIYNNTDLHIDIDGWEIKDKDSDSHIINNGGPLVVNARSYFVIGRDIDPLANGGATVDYELSGIFLANGVDEVMLVFGGTVIDSVGYNDGATFPDPTGASISLSSVRLDHELNDSGENWCTSTAAFGIGDLGTPGFPNTDCGLEILPVSLIAFTARAENEAVSLNWLVGFERDFDYYALEHSTDGYDFKEIHQRRSNGDFEGENTYTYRHEAPSHLRSNYYRLRMVDVDGSYRYSPIVETLIENEATLIISPNPAHDYLDFWYSNKAGQFAIYNAMGQLITQGQVVGEDAMKIDLSALESGTYFLKVISGRQLTTKAFVKM